MGASPEQQQARATEFSSDLRVALLKAPDNSSCESAHSPTTNAKRNLSIVGRNVRRLTPGGVRSSAFTLISTSMGAGVLALPFVLKQAGLVIGTMLVAIAGLLALVTMTIIMRASSRLDCKTYGKLVGACAGTWAQEAFDIVLFVYINGAMVAYFIFLGDFLTVVMNQFGAPVLFQQRWFIMLIGVGIGIPMCMPRKLSALRNVTPLSTFALLMLSFTAVVYAPQLHIDSIASGEQVQMASITWSLIPSFNICMFSFLCHNNVVPVISELVNPSDMRIMKVTASTAVGCGLFFIVIAQAGYFSFMGETGSNFLVNYPSREFLPSLCRCLFSISLTVGLVMNNHPAASAFIGFLQRCMASTIGGQADSGERSSQNANYGVARQVDLSSPEATAVFVPHSAII